MLLNILFSKEYSFSKKNMAFPEKKIFLTDHMPSLFRELLDLLVEIKLDQLKW